MKKTIIAGVLLLIIGGGFYFWNNSKGIAPEAQPINEKEYAPFAGAIEPSDPITDPATALVHSYVTADFRPVTIVPNPFPKPRTEHLVILTDRDPSKPSCKFLASPEESKTCYYFLMDTPQKTSSGVNDPYTTYPRFITSWVSSDRILPQWNAYNPQMLSRVSFIDETTVMFTAFLGDDIDCQTKSSWKLNTITGQITELSHEKITSGCGMYN